MIDCVYNIKPVVIRMGLAESAVEAERISSFLGLSLEFILSLEQKEEGNILWTGILQKVEEYEELKRSKVVLEVNYG